jgi:hypothetical protein
VRALVLGLVALASAAHADEGVVWVPAPAGIRKPSPPPPSGELLLARGETAAIWIEPLDVVRVQAVPTAGRAAPGLRFSRETATASGGRVLLGGEGIPIREGEWYLAQPPGRGDTWLITAEADARLRLERAVTRSGRLVWDDARHALAGWIDADASTPPPPLPPANGSRELLGRAVAERDLARALVALDPSLKPGLTAWRKASALSRLAAIRPLVRGDHELDVPSLAGTDRSTDVPGDLAGAYARADRDAVWRLRLAAPGVLRVDVRPLLPATATPGAPVVVRVRAAGRVIAQRRIDPVPLALSTDAPVIPGAAPPRQPLTIDGALVGQRGSLVVPLRRGRVEYSVELEGAPALVRATVATPRTRLFAALGREADPSAWLADARAALAVSQSNAGRLARALVDAEDGRFLTTLPEGLPPLLGALAVALGAPGEAPAIPARAPREAAWVVRLALLDRFADDAPRGRAVLAAAPDEPPEAFLAALADRYPGLSLLERLRSPQIGLYDLAWREAPVDPAILERYRGTWRDGAWRTLAARDDDGRPVPSLRFIAGVRPGTAPPVAEPGVLWRLPAAATTVMVPAVPAAAQRAVVLELFAMAPQGTDPITVALGEARFTALALDPVEALALAVAPGPHRLVVAGEPQLAVYASAPPEGATAGDARLRRYVPLAAGVRFPLPEAETPGPVRVQLRVRAEKQPRDRTLSLRFDVGGSQAVRVTPGPIDALALPIGAAPTVTEELTFVVRPPIGARSLWLEGDTAGVVAAVSVRRAPGTAVAELPSRRACGGDPDCQPTQAIAEVSRKLAAAKTDAETVPLLVERAHLLLDAGQLDYARQDLLRLARRPGGAGTAGAEEALLLRFEGQTDAASLDTRAALPLALSPATLLPSPAPALVELAPLVPRLRSEGATALPRRDLAGRLIAARLAARAGRPADAAAEIFALGDAGRGFAALAFVTRAVEDVVASGSPLPDGWAALAFALASHGRELADHPDLRRAATTFAARSRWVNVEGTDAHAGLTRLFLAGTTPPSTPTAAVRQALVAAPWPSDTAIDLVAKNAVGLELEVTQPTRVSAQFFCVAVRTPAPAECPIVVRAPGSEQRKKVALGAPLLVPMGTLAPGRARVEVVLDDASPVLAGSVRFVTDRPLPGSPGREADGHLVPTGRSVRAFLASKDQPIAVTLLGPGAVRVEARALGATANAELLVEARAGKEVVTQTVALVRSADARVRAEGAEGAVAAETETWILLPAGQPYRVTVRPSSGRIAARIALRQDAPADNVPAGPPAAWWQRANVPPLVSWPASPPPIRSIDAIHVRTCADRRGWGTLSLGVVGARDGAEELDVPDADPKLYGEIGATWRRAFGLAGHDETSVDQGLWLRAGPFIRFREPGPKTGAFVLGGEAGLEWRGLPGGLRLRVDGGFYGQDTTAQRLIFAGRGGLTVERSIALGRSAAVVPSLRGRVRGGKTPVEPEGIDPDVYSAYAAQHPLAVTPRLALRLAPWRDFSLSLAGQVVTNADVVSLDQLGGSAVIAALLPLLGGTELELRYRPSRRLADADRAESFFRQDLGASLAWSIGRVRTGRVWIGADWDLVVVPGEVRQVIRVGLRWDWTGGRGLDDFAPSEQRFDTLVEDRQWAEVAPTP